MHTSISKHFDLNIEKVLEHWTVAHAVREVIANALDEQALSDTREPVISRDSRGVWHFRDFGRGIHYEHLTQKENDEKLARPELVIGKFGVGLKDALATFDRHNIGVAIRSRFCQIAIGKVPKYGFEEIRTLHALISPPEDPNFDGTDVELSGVADADIAEAKQFFLRYAGEDVLETTPHGAILRPTNGARIYVNGVRVAEEDNFLFSYNVTSVSPALRRALNRERTNVGRGAYAERVKAILLASSSSTVAQALALELSSLEHGQTHDEMHWIDVQIHACQVLNASGSAIFVTPQQMFADSRLVDYARGEGYEVVVVPTALAAKLPSLRDAHGQPIRDLDVFYHDWESSFSFEFVSPDELSRAERAVFDKTLAIIELAGKRKGSRVDRVLISETMRVDRAGYEFTGLWRPADRSIVIKRNQLRRLHLYAGSLLHELTHASTGTEDRTLEFEDGLSRVLGIIAGAALGRNDA